MIPGLEPFSEYRLTVLAFNSKGAGPESIVYEFRTPEGGKEGEVREGKGNWPTFHSHCSCVQHPRHFSHPQALSHAEQSTNIFISYVSVPRFFFVCCSLRTAGPVNANE